MREMIGRMVRCGIPEATAVKVYEDFARRGRLDALLTYIEVQEAACGMEGV